MVCTSEVSLYPGFLEMEQYYISAQPCSTTYEKSQIKLFFALKQTQEQTHLRNAERATTSNENEQLKLSCCLINSDSNQTIVHFKFQYSEVIKIRTAR